MSNSRTRCLLPIAMSLLSFLGIKKKKTFGENCKNVISDLKNGRHFPSSRSFEVKFTNKVPLTPSNVPTKFCWNNQKRLGEKCKNVISDFKNGCHFPWSRSFEVKFADMVPLSSSNVSTKFHSNNQNRLGEKCKSVIFLI